MKALLVKSITFFISLSVAVCAMIWWLGRPAPFTHSSVPGMDNVPPGARNRIQKVEIGKYFKLFDDKYDRSMVGEWPRFRGKDFSNICRDGIKLLERWPESGVRAVWRTKLGEGHAAPVIYKGRVFLLDYLEDEQADALRCFSLNDGHELWRRWYKVEVKRNHGRSRTIPAVTEDYVVTIGPKCQVMCVRTGDGKFLWGIDLAREYGTEVPQWYAGQCPLIDGSVVVLAPGGRDALLMGVEASNGKVLWKTPNPDNWKMSHSSIVPMTLAGRRMYVYCALGGVVGVAADGEERGQVLWKTAAWSPSVIAPTPTVMNDGMIFLTAGYGAGSMTIRVTFRNGRFEVQEINRFRPRQGLALEQQTPVFSDGLLFGIMPKDAGAMRTLFVGCIPDNVSQFRIVGPRDMRFGLGPFIKADGKFYILDDNGTLTIMKITGEQCSVLDSRKILDGHDAWGPIAVADGFMLARDSTSMVCLDMREAKK